MAKGDKYIALTAYLEKSGKDAMKMSFAEIEKIIGFRLSNSAYLYPAQWSNSESHSLAFGWLNAGYLTRQVDIPKQMVEFVREEKHQSQVVSSVSRSILQHKDATLTAEEAIRCIREYFEQTIKDVHGRYLSWQHCYNAFTKNRDAKDENTLDYLSLHLAFYLASWGMYRGSSFLLQKDYKVHIPIVKILMEEQYNRLVGIAAEELIRDENLNLLEDVSERIRNAYADESPSFAGITNNATDTLITKILLGTLGCVPAYDRYYIQAVKHYGISVGNYNRESVRDVAKFYLLHRDKFEIVREEISTQGMEYPVMKLMDMCMWQSAFEVENVIRGE